MTHNLPLSDADSGPGGFPETPVHVTLPAPARTSTRSKPRASTERQSAPNGRQLDLESFFGPPPELPPTGSEKPDSDPRNVFAHEPEPNTVSKYLFWYGFACPLFWLFGAIIFFTAPRPLANSRRTSADVEASGNPISSMFAQGGSRNSWRLRSLHVQLVERRWSLRCLYAWITLLVLIFCLVIGLWAGRVGTFANR
ncbi:hypothetical protein RSOLAG22IIIB_06719 [Rhizoctonia solani]|uniref:Uncharacterized protein n=1 Tax=Rhizoctonia solani TaxID=456999 RepID=A0A0K6GGD7_9AGAM|nr:hypothetical protein RSOLAG22IIIB_06719 [Rhizoctonia solani]